MSVSIPLLDVLADLNSRFDSSTYDVFHLPLILPNSFIKPDIGEEDVDKSIDKLINRFYPLLGESQSIGVTLWKNEYLLRKKKWSRKSSISGTAIEALESCDEDVYPIIH